MSLKPNQYHITQLNLSPEHLKMVQNQNHNHNHIHRKICNLFQWVKTCTCYKSLYIVRHFVTLKSLVPIDRKFHGHGENDGFVLYEYKLNNAVVFANIQTSAFWKQCQVK